MKNKTTIKTLVMCAVFSALCFVGTMIIRIPMPLGYINIGDVFVLLSAWCLGLWSIIPSALGSALADVVSGYTFYAPATLIIKGFVALTAHMICSASKNLIAKNLALNAVFRTLSAVLAEIIMVLSYLLYDSILYGFSTAIINTTGSIIQGVVSVVLAVALFMILYNVRFFRQYFPKLIYNSETQK